MNDIKKMNTLLEHIRNARGEADQWQTLIGNMLDRLELPKDQKALAEKEYKALGRYISERLDLAEADVTIIPQGSMRTQTTIKQRGKFDIDIVAKLSGGTIAELPPEEMFTKFGEALEGQKDKTGDPDPKNRCWRLQYPGERFYFDVTPAVHDIGNVVGSELRARDKEKGWTPTNPEEFADWFCKHADARFPFQQKEAVITFDKRASVEPLPMKGIPLDDILRRTVQLIKLHRDQLYASGPEEARPYQPISVIITTLATEAYSELLKTRADEFSSPIEVVLEIIANMPKFVKKDGEQYFVWNPILQEKENFADKWNQDNARRAKEFYKWHSKLEDDIADLLHQGAKNPSEEKIKKVFGMDGVNAWHESRPTDDVVKSILSANQDYKPPSRPAQSSASKDTAG